MTDSEAEFAIKMQNFFQRLRDRCHDFLVRNDYNNDLVYECRKIKKIVDHFEMEGSENRIQRQKLKPLNLDQLALKQKKPTPPFIQFYRLNHQIQQDKHPDLSFQDIRQVLSKEWGSLPPDKQEPYKQMYIDEKKEYERKMNERNQPLEYERVYIKQFIDHNSEKKSNWIKEMTMKQRMTLKNLIDKQFNQKIQLQIK